VAGYTRADTANNIADGNIINAADFDAEYDAIEAAFDASTGHTHDGTSAEGAPITVVGPVQDVVVSITAITPKTDNTIDLGSSLKEFKDLYIDGTANIDSLVADTADINGGTVDASVIGGTTPAAGTFTTATATTGNITTVNATTVDTTNLEVTNLKAKDGTAAGSIADSTGVVTLNSSVLTTADINGGTIDNSTIATSDITVGAGKTLNVSAGTLTLANDQISGDKVEGGTISATTITTLTSTTGNITNVNATTVDATNVEVTNLKAKDGTAAATIADSTGVVTIPSSVLTSTDINGGTIDATTVGATTPSSGAFTTLTASGTATFTTLNASGTATLNTLASSGATITGGTINGTTIGATTPAAGTFTTAAATTGNITTVNATTVDTTNIEVTNIKAKDGTSAGSIADSTGVVTLASSVLTTTDINGGTIDGAAIGASSPSTGAFTTLSTTGGLTVGGDLTVNGTTTTINSTTLTVDDLNITVASGAASAAAADGAGLTVDGANATILYTNATDTWDFNKGVVTTSLTASGAFALTGDQVQISEGGTGATTAADARTNLGLGTAATTASTDYATAAQGALADSALQSGDNVSTLTNDAGYATTAATVAKTASTGSAVVPAGTQAQRDGSPSAGYFRFNSDAGAFEGYNGSAWGSIGGGATGGGGDAVFVENDQTVTTNYTIPATKNAMSTGPVTINSGVTVTVSTGSRYVVI